MAIKIERKIVKYAVQKPEDKAAAKAAEKDRMEMKLVAQAGESVSGAPHTTGLPGVLLWATPTASGVLTAMGRNISLESGMQLTLGVIAR